MTHTRRQENPSRLFGPRPEGLRRLLRNDRGATLVEFAVSSLLFMTIALGTIEFSRMIMHYNVVSNAAREGVRYASVRGGNSGHPATATDIQNFVAGRSSGLLTAGNVTVTWPVDTLVGSPVQVQVTYGFAPIVGLLPSASISLSSTTQMIIVK